MTGGADLPPLMSFVLLVPSGLLSFNECIPNISREHSAGARVALPRMVPSSSVEVPVGPSGPMTAMSSLLCTLLECAETSEQTTFTVMLVFSISRQCKRGSR